MGEREAIEEAISHATAIAEREGCSTCGQEHAQLATWLRRLVELDFPSALPDEPLPIEEDSNVISLDEHRIRVEQEFEDESVAYLEALWGKTTWAFNAAIRDLEAMRHGHDDKSLRPPQTTYEAMHMVMHCRALANDMARFFGVEDMIRPEDDIQSKRKGQPFKNV